MTGRREQLAQRRKALGLTQEDLAEVLAVERTTVVRWERGETEPLPWIRPKLAATLRISVDRLGELLNDSGLVVSGTGRAGVAAVPRQLPATIADFTGRAAELQALTRILDDADGGVPGTVVISAIGGTAGVGKTALALHWAHEVADRFEDGQLYVNLRGFDPSGIPATPAEAIRGFLDPLGVAPDKIPPAPDAQAGLYRSLLSDKRMLIVLDNARDEQQVRPLLPASPDSLVIVTSRNELTGLVAANGARLVTLDVLPHAEAVQLLTARIGLARATADPEAVNEIASLCACLPLALAVAAARAVARPGLALATLAAELRDTATRIEALDAGDPAVSVRAVFSLSYQHLNSAAARMFRLLGLHPGPDISVLAAASLSGVGEFEARRLLRVLARDCLINESAPDRYAFHDLLRAYAAAQARDADSEPDRAAAVTRLFDHYLHTASAGQQLLSPWATPPPLTPLSCGAVVRPLGDYQQAMTWFEIEQDALVAAIAYATASDSDRIAWQLARVVSVYLHRRAQWHLAMLILSTGVAAASRLGDTAGQAVSCRLLAHACYRIGDYDQAGVQVRRSIELYRRIDDRAGEANALIVLSEVDNAQGRYADELSDTEQALGLFRAVGDRAQEAGMLNNLAWWYGRYGADYQQSRAFSRESLALSAELGLRRLEGYASDTLGYAEHHLGNLAGAAACYERALSIAEELGDRWAEVDAVTHLGDTCHAAGELGRASKAWQQALAILDDLEHPDAEKVRAKLAGLPPSVAE